MARLPPLGGRSYTPTGARASDGSLVQSCAKERDLPIQTPEEALEVLRKERVLSLTDTRGMRSLVGEVLGKVHGSWWGHPEGGKVYAIANELERSREVLGAKLVDGKVAFVYRTLWPQLLRVVTDPNWRRERQKGLSQPARQLLAQVEKDGKLALQGRAPARGDLEKRALLLSSSEHTPAGRHAVVLRSWEDWATEDLRQEAKALEFDAALAEVRAAHLTL
jgi:hypothetical protein